VATFNANFDEGKTMTSALINIKLGQSHLSAAWIKPAEHPPKPLDAIDYLVDGCVAQVTSETALATPSTAANTGSKV